MKRTKIIHANDNSIDIQTTIGSDYRFSIPTSIRHKVPTNKQVIISIKTVKEV